VRSLPTEFDPEVNTRFDTKVVDVHKAERQPCEFAGLS
jgi:hypothetical protein